MARTNLHLITPVVGDPAVFRVVLEAAMQASGAASVYVRLGTMDEHDVKRSLLALAPVVQNAGAALLIDPPVDLREIARWGVDGVHVSKPESAKTVLEALKPDRIVGVGGLRSKDAAMSAGDEGCDYVMFGEPRADGSLPPLELVVDRCQWWAEVFNIPCIGYAATPESVEIIAATGVEFIAPGDWVFAGSTAEISTRLTKLRTLLKG
jgi:thiamine-phosphate pyrophosphorylase